MLHNLKKLFSMLDLHFCRRWEIFSSMYFRKFPHESFGYGEKSFFLYGAAGNIFLVAPVGANVPDGQEIREACFRWNADGILYGKEHSRKFYLRIFNRDASEAEKSGNGVRIFATHLFMTGQCEGNKINVQTAGGGVCCYVRPTKNRHIYMVKANLRSCHLENQPLSIGIQSFHFEKDASNFGFDDILSYPVSLNGYCVHVGNPHYVIPVHRLESPWEIFGKIIGCHPLFPMGTNVEFLQIIGREDIAIKIEERGVGSTRSCGTGAVAAAIVAHRIFFCSKNLCVHMDGGTLMVSLKKNCATIEGPIRIIPYAPP
jgi:diaminopimelate epimerase